MMTRKVDALGLFAGALSLLTLAGGCTRHDTTASRSAAAYDEAQRKGAPVPTGASHGGHPAAPEATGSPEVKAQVPPRSDAADHSQMPGMVHGASSGSMAGMQHPDERAAAGPGQMAGMDHSKMGHEGPTPAAGVDHSSMPGMQHPSGAAAPTGAHAMAGMDHAMPSPKPEPVSQTATPGQLAATLRGSEIDAPAPTSVDDAARSAAMAKEMADGHAMSHGSYRQLDAGRDDVRPTSPKPSPSPSPRHEHSVKDDNS